MTDDALDPNTILAIHAVSLHDDPCKAAAGRALKALTQSVKSHLAAEARRGSAAAEVLTGLLIAIGGLAFASVSSVQTRGERKDLLKAALQEFSTSFLAVSGFRATIDLSPESEAASKGGGTMKDAPAAFPDATPEEIASTARFIELLTPAIAAFIAAEIEHGARRATSIAGALIGCGGLMQALVVSAKLPGDPAAVLVEASQRFNEAMLLGYATVESKITGDEPEGRVH